MQAECSTVVAKHLNGGGMFLGGNSGLYYEEIPLIAGSQQDWLGLVSWPSGELPYFMIKHYLGISFNNGITVIRPQLFPNSPQVNADIRYQKSRLKIDLPGAGPYKYAQLNGKKIRLDESGAVHLPSDFKGGELRFIK